MKDTNKIKEKDSKGDMKIIFVVGAIFLVAFGLIVYGIVKLTNQYFSLKEQLAEKKTIESTQTISPDNGKKIIVESDKIKIEELKKSAEETVSDNKPKKYTVEEKKSDQVPQTKVETPKDQKIAPNDEQKTEKKVEEKPVPKQEKVKTTEEKGKIVINADKNEVKKETSDNKTTSKKDEKPQPQTKKPDVKAAAKEDKAHNKPQKEPTNKELTTKKIEPVKSETTKQLQTVNNSGGNYSLQLMAFKDEEHTKKEAEKLKTKLKDIYVVKADLGEKGIWYRIRYGRNLTKDDALKLKEKLQKEYGINAILATQ